MGKGQEAALSALIPVHHFHPSFYREFLTILMFIVALVLLIILSPGMLVNHFTDRLPGHPHGGAFIVASARDWLTWVISLFFWAGCLLLCLRVKRR